MNGDILECISPVPRNKTCAAIKCLLKSHAFGDIYWKIVSQPWQKFFPLVCWLCGSITSSYDKVVNPKLMT